MVIILHVEAENRLSSNVEDHHTVTEAVLDHVNGQYNWLQKTEARAIILKFTNMGYENIQLVMEDSQASFETRFSKMNIEMFMRNS